MAGASVRIISNKLPNVARNTPLAIAKRQKRGAEMIKAGAQRRSRRDTGEMEEGWQVEGSGPAWLVFNDVEHVIFNEFGTVHMTAQPMLRPASDEVMGKMPDLYAGFEGDLVS